MLMSMLISLILPKLLGVEEFAYWQLFILYSGYVGFFHFGLSDGLYLRYGGTDLDDMDKDLLGSQFRMMVAWQISISLIAFFAIPFVVQTDARRFVWVMTAIYLVLANATWCMGFIFQAANETRIYSIGIILSKALVVLYIIYTWVSHTYDYRSYIIFYVVAQGVACAFSLYKGRKFLFSKWIGFKKTVTEVVKNAAIGINLTFANIASSLTLGIGKIFVDHRWGLNAFGVLSLAVSLVNFALQFISQASMVLFPQMRQTGKEKQEVLFNSLDQVLGIFLCGALLLYTPCSYLVSAWLPDYSNSLVYLSVLLPVCVLDGKMQLLYNTYMKVFRWEKLLMAINIGSCVLSGGLCVVFSCIYNNVVSVAFAIVFAIAARNVVSSILISRVAFNRRINVSTVLELVLCFWFVTVNRVFSAEVAFLCYAVAYLIVFLALFRRIRSALRDIKK